MSNDGRASIPDNILDRCRNVAFAAMTPATAATTHLSISARLLTKGRQLSLVDRIISVPEDSVLVFVDEMPGANFGHPCRYRFHSPDDGRLLREVPAQFPPEIADPRLVVEPFHAPLRQAVFTRPLLHVSDWAKVRPWPWLLNDDNRYALLFTSQISNRRHVEDLELAWRVLHRQLGFSARNIYVLCYDGTIGATDATSVDMAKWVGDDTSYQMAVDSSATKANLQTTIDTIGKRMDSESLLFVHTNNHGSQTGLCIDNSSVLTPTEWGTMLAGMPAFGQLVVTMEQCYSGAFMQPTLDNSTAARTSFASAVPADKVSAGDTHFDPWARTWFESVNGGTAYGGSLPTNPDADRNGRISVREAFDYSDAQDTASYDDPQYADSPRGCGKYIHLTRRPTLADIIKEITKKMVAIDKVIHKGPLPDPGPDWAAELLPSLYLLSNLAARLDAKATASEKAAASTASAADKEHVH